MADGVLFVRGQLGVAAVLGVGALVRFAHAAVGGDEQRVVAKAVVAAQPCKGNAARAFAHAGQVPAVRQDEAYRRDELCPPLPGRHRLHGSQKLIVVGFIVAVVAAVAGAVHAGCAVQRIHTQAGVIGDGGQTADLADSLGLDESILGKGCAGLLRLDGDAQLFLADHLMSLRFQNAAQLAKLSGVAGGCTNFHLDTPSAFKAPPERKDSPRPGRDGASSAREGNLRFRAAVSGRNGERVLF